MKNIIFTVLLILSLPSFSAWTDGTQVVKSVIWIENYHGFYVSPELYDDNGISGCATKNLYVMDASVSEKDVDRLYSMMLTGFATGSKMHVMLSGCGPNGIITFTGLQINKD
jgi:hypothetical protein